MEYIKLNVGDLDENCYIAYENGVGFAVDPGADARRIKNEAERHGILISAIFLTHGHFDHVGAVKELKEHYGAKVYMSLADNYMTENPEMNLNFGAYSRFDGFKGDVFPDDGQEIYVGTMKIKVFKTPGHTQGGLSYLCGKYMFSGDTLFKGTVGRTDFPGGDFEQLMLSLKRVYFTLPDDTIILPGHNEITDIATEKKENPYFLQL